uniref:Uncharacterized protein n=1 Tax=Setaria viridis TaxID=4556 RepID=A0A4U6UK83_SETVI|nr:hypothetical protein SEVIR_6G205050v2 [Setaria viridis]
MCWIRNTSTPWLKLTLFFLKKSWLKLNLFGCSLVDSTTH